MVISMNSTAKFSIDSNNLIIGSKSIQFPDRIKKVLEIDDKIIVLAAYGQLIEFGKLERTVFCVNEHGEILWQIEEYPFRGRDPAPYTNIWLNESNELMAGNWRGYDFKVDLSNGKVTVDPPDANLKFRPW